MAYKDKDKQREADRERQRRYRRDKKGVTDIIDADQELAASDREITRLMTKGMTEGVTNTGCDGQGVTVTKADSHTDVSDIGTV